MLEGFAAQQADPVPSAAGRFTAGDQVRVKVAAADSIVGRVKRPHDALPSSHVVIAPEGGGAHVVAKVGQVSMDTPERNARERQQREADALKQMQQNGPPGAPAAGSGPQGKSGSVQKPAVSAPVRESSVLMLLEAFPVPPAPKPSETPAQSQKLGAQQVKAANAQLAAGWNASKHPRAAGGKFGYTTGGKRATRAPTAKTGTLTSGSTGTLVKSIQRQLGITADGQYGPSTLAAVERYQKQHGLTVDGVVGRQTLASLRGNPSAAKIAPGPIAARTATVKRHVSQRQTRTVKPGPWQSSVSKPGPWAKAPAGRFAGGTVVR